MSILLLRDRIGLRNQTATVLVTGAIHNLSGFYKQHAGQSQVALANGRLARASGSFACFWEQFERVTHVEAFHHKWCCFVPQ